MSYDPSAAVHDAARLAALHRLHLLDSPAEAAFDRLTRLAARLIHAPVALVCLVEDDRQFFKSCVGVAEPWASQRETPLSHSFCQHIVASREPLIVADARAHPLLHDNPAISELDVIAYAGIPLLTSDGHVLGSFCVIDSQPREWTADEFATLGDLAASVMTEIELRGDIIERKRAEAALRRSVTTNRALLNAMPDTMLRISRDGTLVNFKAAKERALGPALDRMVGQSIRGLFPAEVMPQMAQCIEQALQGGETQVFEYSQPLGGATHDYEARVVVSGDDEVLAIVRDITERKRVERLRHEFVAIVSYELRTPLTSIRGSLGLLAGGVAGELSSRARAMVDIAHSNSERLVRLINDMLDVEKIESGKLTFNLKPTELVPLVEQALEANQAYAAQLNVTFALEQPLAGVLVNADSDRLMQVFTNLLSNAAKFSPAHDRVVITMSRHAGRVRVTISDHGPGIPEEFRSRIFQKFAQAALSDTRRKGGSGLGLSIAKAIVDRLGGELGFETSVGGGTSFYIDLPEWRLDEATPPASQDQYFSTTGE